MPASRLIPAVLVAALAAPAAAQSSGTYVSDPAQPHEDLYLPELRDPTRFMIGFDFGLGVVGGFCDECDRSLGGLAVDFYSGALVTRRLAVLGEIYAVLHLLPSDNEQDRGLVSHTFLTAAARFWAGPQFWLQAGVGASTFRVDGDDVTDYAPAVTFAIGGEIGHKPDRGIDLSARFGFGRYDDDGSGITLYNIGAVVGWHWL